jgi:hypothetical protein
MAMSDTDYQQRVVTGPAAGRDTTPLQSAKCKVQFRSYYSTRVAEFIGRQDFRNNILSTYILMRRRYGPRKKPAVRVGLAKSTV